MKQPLPITHLLRRAASPVRSVVAWIILSAFLSLAASGNPSEDLRIEVLARGALQKDKQLASLKLRVAISNGVIALAGDVPSEECKRRAIRLVERVEGVLEVRAEQVHVSKSMQSKPRFTLSIPDDKPTQTRSASPGLAAVTNTSPRPSTLGTEQRVTLLAPEKASVPPRPPEAGRLTANPRTRPVVDPLPATIERLRRGDARYQSIRARVQDATVSIFSGDASSEDVMTFAQQVRHVPGVRHVVIQSGSSR